MCTKFGLVSLKERDYFGYRSVERDFNVETNLRWMGCESVNCIELAKPEIKWRAFVNTAMNLQVL
jgi:hypothetical protein